MNKKKPKSKRKTAPVPEEIQKLWEEIDSTDWRRPPYYGIISKVAREMGITRQAGYNAIRRRSIQFGICLLAEKRKLEQSVRDVLR